VINDSFNSLQLQRKSSGRPNVHVWDSWEEQVPTGAVLQVLQRQVDVNEELDKVELMDRLQLLGVIEKMFIQRNEIQRE